MIEDEVQAIRDRMRRILASSSEAARDSVLPAEQNRRESVHHAAQDSSITIGGVSDSRGPWVLEEWRRISIPDWQRILRESISRKDRNREEYARWMLRDILLDPGYQEPRQ